MKMKVNATHPDYDEYYPKWRRCSVAYEGEDAVKATEDENLPMLEGQEYQEYEAYLARAQYPDFFSRVIDTFIGLSLTKEPAFELPPAIIETFPNIGGTGVNEMDLLRRSMRHNFTKGRMGMLVGKHDELDHPHIALYSAESIVNWPDGKVVLMEEYDDVDLKDPFIIKKKTQYRVLMLNEGAYTQQVYRGQGDKWELYEEILFLDSRGDTIDFIPFTYIGVDGIENKIGKPPMLSFVNTSMSWYRNSADYEHGIHFTALPWYYVTGVSSNRQGEDTIRIGSSRALKLKDPQSKAGVVEFSGAGMKAIADAMQRKEDHMSELGAKILMDQVKGVEAAEAKRIRSKADNSMAANIIEAVARGLEVSFGYIAKIQGYESSNIEVVINKELISNEMSESKLALLLKAVMAGKLSLVTFLEVLKTGKLPKDFDEKDELDRIEGEALDEDEETGFEDDEE